MNEEKCHSVWVRLNISLDFKAGSPFDVEIIEEEWHDNPSDSFATLASEEQSAFWEALAAWAEAAKHNAALNRRRDEGDE